jgi:hypothetical protein
LKRRRVSLKQRNSCARMRFKSRQASQAKAFLFHRTNASARRSFSLSSSLSTTSRRLSSSLSTTSRRLSTCSRLLITLTRHSRRSMGCLPSTSLGCLPSSSLSTLPSTSLGCRKTTFLHRQWRAVRRLPLSLLLPRNRELPTRPLMSWSKPSRTIVALTFRTLPRMRRVARLWKTRPPFSILRTVTLRWRILTIRR